MTRRVPNTSHFDAIALADYQMLLGKRFGAAEAYRIAADDMARRNRAAGVVTIGQAAAGVLASAARRVAK